MENKEGPLLRVMDHSGGVFPGIFGKGVPPGSPNTDPVTDQTMSFFHTRFQTRGLKSISIFRRGLGRNTLRHHFWTRAQTKRFLKTHFELAYYFFFLIHLELKRRIRSYTPVVS